MTILTIYKFDVLHNCTLTETCLVIQIKQPGISMPILDCFGR